MNKSLFQTVKGLFTPPANTVNEAGGTAYKFSPKHALAQYAATGCFSNIFYADASEQLDKVLDLTKELDAEFVAKVAIYAREKGYMKDMPALLVAVLSTKDKELLEKVFPRVIDNGKMLRNFVQIMRSGVVGRKSLGSLPKRLVREWFENRKAETIFKQSVGQAPSFADILKMIHAKPQDAEKEALFGYFIGRDIDADKLPELVKAFEKFKTGDSLEVPSVPFQMLTALPLSTKEWTEIARNAAWQMTRMNLNTFQRHGVFQNAEMVQTIANRLRDVEAIKKAKVFPYQLLSAYSAASNNAEIPRAITEALQDALEIATENVPAINGKIYVLPDVSGSMGSAVTGYRKGSTSTVRCIDVAGLVASALLRKNPLAEVLPFENSVVNIALNPRDSVMTNAQKLASIGGGGTNCSAPLRDLNKTKARGDLVIYVSDNESWMDTNRTWNSGTETMKQWNEFKSRNKDAKLVCIDIQPNATTQTQERADILNIGGFSDQVFTLISEFAGGRMNAEHWVGVIKTVEIWFQL
ncbi:MAG TPA: TROVE domain-containing protein [Pyrinomonadaceae bacterium]|nr:TROVE domain-containing protein [Pyrinomonadaceae bacterium]